MYTSPLTNTNTRDLDLLAAPAREANQNRSVEATQLDSRLRDRLAVRVDALQAHGLRLVRRHRQHNVVDRRVVQPKGAVFSLHDESQVVSVLARGIAVQATEHDLRAPRKLG